jgi:hypothetical protein
MAVLRGIDWLDGAGRFPASCEITPAVERPVCADRPAIAGLRLELLDRLSV